MDLYSSITRRKSCRKYDMNPLEQAVLSEIENAIKSFAPLLPNAAFEYRFVQKVKGRFHVEAPHYLIASGHGQAGEMENAGFIIEQLVLWLDAMEIGSVWLGGSKDAAGGDANDIIVLAFGRAAEALHREKEAFKRKPVESITNAPDDICIQAAHLAPSGMNTQPWYFEKQGDRVLVYKQKLKPPISLAYKLSDIDMGIGLCHYALACEKTGGAFNYKADEALPPKAGYIPFGAIYQ